MAQISLQNSYMKGKDMSEIKAKNVEGFVRDLITLAGLFECDDEGYVVAKHDDDQPVVTKVGNQMKRLMVMKELIKDNDALIINPLNENISESPDSKWLYTIFSAGITRRIIELARHLKLVLELENEKDSNIGLSNEMLQFAAKHKDFDAKVLAHFEIITKDKLKFSNVWYNRKFKEARFRCVIYSAEAATQFPQVTKKSWKAIISFMSDILDLDNDIEVASNQISTKYSMVSDLITVPKLESILSVYLKLYSRLNRFLDMCESDDDSFVVDITSLGNHLSHLEDYYKLTKWFVTSTSTTSVPDNPAIRPAVSITTPSAGGIPSNPMTQQPYQGGIVVEQESGIPSNPARRGIEYASPGVYGPGNPTFGMNAPLYNQPPQHQQVQCIPVNQNYQQSGGYIPTQPTGMFNTRY